MKKERWRIIDPEMGREVIAVYDPRTKMITLRDGRVYHKDDVELVTNYGTEFYDDAVAY
jgi:hypothetical protein